MNNDFLEGFIEECVKLGVPEGQIETLYKQAVMYTKMAEKDASFIDGFKSEMTKAGSMTGNQVDEWTEKAATIWSAAMEKAAIGWGALGAGAGALGLLGLGASVVGPSLQSGMLSEVGRGWDRMRGGRGWDEKMQEMGDMYGTGGIAAREQLIRSLGGNIRGLYQDPTKIDRLMSQMQRQNTVHNMGAIGRARAAQLEGMANLGAGTSMGMGGMGMGGYGGYSPYYRGF